MFIFSTEHEKGLIQLYYLVHLQSSSYLNYAGYIWVILTLELNRV